MSANSKLRERERNGTGRETWTISQWIRVSLSKIIRPAGDKEGRRGRRVSFGGYHGGLVTSLVGLGREYSRIEVNKSKRWCSTRAGHHPVVHRRNPVPANNGRGIVASVYRDTGCGLLSARVRNVSSRQKKKKKEKGEEEAAARRAA